MIKILWIFTGGLRRNGICVSQLDYYKEINKEKYQVDVLAVHNNTQEMIEAYKHEGCRVIEMPDRRKHLIKYIKELKKLFEKEKYDVVHVHGSSTLMFIELSIAKICGVKNRIAHSRNTTCDRPWLESIFRGLFNNSYTYAMACGEEAGKWLFKDKEFTIFHNGKDLNKYRFNDGIREEYRIKLKIDKEIAIGHVGLFNVQKNHDFLIDIFDEIHKQNVNTKLFLIGTGPKIDEIKNKVNKLGLLDSVIFCGNVSNVQDYLQAMDVMLFPSLFEGLPNVVVEWQASGLPIIMSDKITKECCIAPFAMQLPINEDSISLWSNEVDSIIKKHYDRQANSAIGCKKLIEYGFDIFENEKKLEKIYSNL